MYAITLDLIDEDLNSSNNSKLCPTII